jgi:hypothetical protein
MTDCTICHNRLLPLEAVTVGDVVPAHAECYLKTLMEKGE